MYLFNKSLILNLCLHFKEFFVQNFYKLVKKAAHGQWSIFTLAKMEIDQ